MTIAIIGGDKRYVYLYELLCQIGYDVLTFGLLDGQDSNITLEDTITSADFIILPIPFKAPADLYEYISSRQTIISGYIPPDIRNFFKERGISNYDFSNNPYFLMQNSITTAEGAIMYALGNPYCTISTSNSLVMGYGKCGKEIAKRLILLGSNVSVFEKDPVAVRCSELSGCKSIDNLCGHSLTDYDYIFNTIPERLTPCDTLQTISSHACVIDITHSGGFDIDYANKAGINIMKTGSIPPVTAPYSIALCIVDIICSIINKRGDINAI